MIVAGCVKRTGGAYPTVNLTTLGGAVMRDQTRVELDLEAVEADTSDEEITLPPNYSETRRQTYALPNKDSAPPRSRKAKSPKPLTIEALRRVD